MPSFSERFLPAVVCEGLVGLGHLVSVFATLHSGTQTVRCVQDLVHQTFDHGLLAASLRVANQPAQSQCGCTAWLDLNRNLVGSATNAAGTNLEGWTEDRKSTRLNSSHVKISYAVFCL